MENVQNWKMNKKGLVTRFLNTDKFAKLPPPITLNSLFDIVILLLVHHVRCHGPIRGWQLSNVIFRPKKIKCINGEAVAAYYNCNKGTATESIGKFIPDSSFGLSNNVKTLHRLSVRLDNGKKNFTYVKTTHWWCF